MTFLGNPVETIARPLPIVLKKLNVEFYPEGGDLVAGLSDRVYFQVRTTLGKPADLTGRLFEDGKELPVAVQTLHDAKEPGVNQGEGRFEFTPKSGKKYELQIDSPIGINGRVPLPAVKDDGVTLNVPDGVAEAGQPIKAVVHSTKPRDLMIGLYCRGRLLHSVQLKKGETEAVLSPTDGAGGVCRVTVFEETAVNGERRELKPVAERLVYRRPAELLTVNLRPNLSSYVPGQKVQLGVETFDEKGEPAPAVVMLAVVDKSVLTTADEKTYRQMPTHFLLTSKCASRKTSNTPISYWVRRRRRWKRWTFCSGCKAGGDSRSKTRPSSATRISSTKKRRKVCWYWTANRRGRPAGPRTRLNESRKTLTPRSPN